MVELENGVLGNYGVFDQVVVLQWVQNNIGFFGGDLGNVMIFGEFVGLWSVNIFVVSLLVEGFFYCVIGQSGGVFCLLFWFSQDFIGIFFGEIVGCEFIVLFGVVENEMMFVELCFLLVV